MLLPLILCSALAADPTSAVVVSRRTAVSPPEAQALAVLVTQSLVNAGIQVTDPETATRRLASLGVTDTSVCAGRKPCVQELGTQLDVSAVVAVSVSELDKDRSLSLELIRVVDGEVLTRANLLYPAKQPPPDEALRAFAAQAKAALKPVVADAPVQAVLEPTQPANPALVEAPSGVHTKGVIAGGGAVLAVAAAVTLFALSVSARGELSRGATLNDGSGRIGSDLTGSQAQAIAGRSNAEFVAASVSGVLGIALGTAAVVLW